MKELDIYLDALRAVHQYFGYNEDWAVIPLDDRREYFWALDGEDTVYYALSMDSVQKREGDEEDGYEDEILHRRHLPKAVYVGAEYTLIVVDTHTDGNRFLAVFANDHKC